MGPTSHFKRASQLKWDFLKDISADQLVKKLEEAELWKEAQTIKECHTKETIAKCKGCGKSHPFLNHCDLSICPKCQPILAWKRRQGLEWWANAIKQPKHVVLTVKNVDKFTRSYIARFKKWLVRLRRASLFRNVKGGLWSLEVTNEGNGWHLHAHLLIDCPWMSGSELSILWAKITDGAGYIVKVKDARSGDYLREVVKYSVKGSTLATWTWEHVREYVLATRKARMFGTFGSLWKLRAEWEKWKDENLDSRLRCNCGSTEFEFLSDSEVEWRETVSGGSPPPRVIPSAQMTML